jgi:hypothetical protein
MAKPQKIVFRNGKPVIVIRPKDPSIALQVAHLSVKTQDTELFAKMPELQDYTVIGYLSHHRDGYAVDEKGNIVCRLQPGDSFCTAKE